MAAEARLSYLASRLDRPSSYLPPTCLAACIAARLPVHVSLLATSHSAAIMADDETKPTTETLNALTTSTDAPSQYAACLTTHSKLCSS